MATYAARGIRGDGTTVGGEVGHKLKGSAEAELNGIWNDEAVVEAELWRWDQPSNDKSVVAEPFVENGQRYDKVIIEQRRRLRSGLVAWLPTTDSQLNAAVPRR